MMLPDTSHSETQATNQNEILNLEFQQLRTSFDSALHDAEYRTKALMQEVSVLTQRNELLSSDTEALSLALRAAGRHWTARLESGDAGLPLLASSATDVKEVAELRVAGIMDEFTSSAFSRACTLLLPNLDTWESELAEFDPDLLIVESAWQGNGGSWSGKINRISPELQGLLNWSKNRGVPIVFWNKEDPIHFDSFLSTASLFDFVFTTDIASIERYKSRLNHNRIYLMPFFCEPGLHTPVSSIERMPGASFAGAYYKRYPERTRDFDTILDSLNNFFPVTIYDRNFGEGKEEFEFPERYHALIAGKLSFSEIDKSYKGYDFGINLNSVKQSQSMFARRAFDLILSNTHVISNYSQGLRLMFGDLVTSSDHGPDIQNSVLELLDDSGSSQLKPYSAFVRFRALQKVLAQHTTAHRLEYIASKVWADAPKIANAGVTMVGHASTAQEIESIQSIFDLQSWTNKKLVVVVSAANANIVNNVAYRGFIALDSKDVTIDTITDTEFVSIINPRASYGADYLSNAVRLFGLDDYEAVVMNTSKEDEFGLLTAFSTTTSAGVFNSVCRTAALEGHRISNHKQKEDRFCGESILCVPSFDYGVNRRANQDIDLWEARLNTGVEMERLLVASESIPLIKRTNKVPVGWSESELQNRFPARDYGDELSVSTVEGGVRVNSSLGSKAHKYLYSTGQLPVSDLPVGLDGKRTVHAIIAPGLMASLVVLYFDAAGNRLQSGVLGVNQNHDIAPPDDCITLRLGLRIQGSGTADLSGIAFAPVSPTESKTPVISGSRHLVLTNVYPSPKDLYRNGFVHSRVRRYRESGVDASVFAFNPRANGDAYTFEGVEVQVGAASELRRLLESNDFDSVLVHFMDSKMWVVLKDFVSSTKILVWVHGAEIQPWYRREFNYADDAQRDSAKVASAPRMEFWNSMFSYSHPNIHYIFVSEYFFEEVTSDVGIQLHDWQYSVIHNFIDTDIFNYEDKNNDKKFKILSIRPFASRKYANDLSVQTVLSLRDHPKFKYAEFLFVGDGVLFEETLAPLRGLSNVRIHRGFLSQSEISTLHKDFGVFLTPTRMDSQGVSRDEAMSSGLVPVTTAVTAIPEFVDENSGILAAGESSDEMAAGIARLWEDGNLFSSLSEGAAKRVRRQSAYDQTIGTEVSLILKSSMKRR